MLRSEGYSAHPENPKDWLIILRREAGDSDARGRQQVLDEHHPDGIPPYEPPTRE